MLLIETGRPTDKAVDCSNKQ